MNLIDFYKQKFNLQDYKINKIEHENGLVAQVYKVQLNDKYFILKIDKLNNHLREIYFLEYFANKIPMPKIYNKFEDVQSQSGAILMEYLEGELLNIEQFNNQIAYQCGIILAQIHSNKMQYYGDIIDKDSFTDNPRKIFTQKFQEGLDECKNILPKELIEKSNKYFYKHINNLLNIADGPCIIHRDFRPGNIIVKNNQVQGIIDWASGRIGFAQEDFVAMEHTEWSINSSTKQSFLDGYTSIRPVPEFNNIMPLLRLNRTIATLGFIFKRNLHKKSPKLYDYNYNFLKNFFGEGNEN